MRRLVNGKVLTKEMSPSKRNGKNKDPQNVDAYDPQMDPDLYDGYKFHKTYEAIGDGRRHIWIRRNNAENPKWMTYVNGKRVLQGFTVDEKEPDVHLYRSLDGTTVRCLPEDVVHHHQIIKAGALYSGTPNGRRVSAMRTYRLRSGYKYDKVKGEWYWSRSTSQPSWMDMTKHVPYNST